MAQKQPLNNLELDSVNGGHHHHHENGAATNYVFTAVFKDAAGNEYTKKLSGVFASYEAAKQELEAQAMASCAVTGHTFVGMTPDTAVGIIVGGANGIIM